MINPKFKCLYVKQPGIACARRETVSFFTTHTRTPVENLAEGFAGSRQNEFYFQTQLFRGGVRAATLPLVICRFALSSSRACNKDF
jgi:hypothetical protein